MCKLVEVYLGSMSFGHLVRELHKELELYAKTARRQAARDWCNFAETHLFWMPQSAEYKLLCIVTPPIYWMTIAHFIAQCTPTLHTLAPSTAISGSRQIKGAHAARLAPKIHVVEKS
jgi:hypothetical protein